MSFALLALTLLTAQTEAVAPPVGTHTEIDPWVVCFVRAVDDTRTGLGPNVEEHLKTALLSNTSVTVAPTDELAEAANRMKLPRRRWLDPGVLGPVADELDIDFLLWAVVKSETRYSFKVTLTAVDRSATTTVATSEVSIAVSPGKGRGGASFSSAEAQTLVEKLVAALPAPATIEVADVPGETPPTADAPSGDDWGSDWGDPADAGASTSAVDALLNALAPTFGGRVGVDSWVHPTDLVAPRDDARVDGRQQVDLALRAAVGGNKASGHATLLVRRDFADATRARLEAEEAWAEIELPVPGPVGVRLRGGRGYIAWGTADLWSPTEVLAHFDYRDFLDIEKFPTWHARATATWESFTLEGYVLPVPELNILPPVERIAADGTLIGRNRWVKGTVEGFQAAPAPVSVTLVDNGAPGPSAANVQPAFRLRFSGFGVDTSVGYGWLFDRFPTLRAPEVADLELPLPQQSVDVTIETEVLRRHAFTSDIEWTIAAVRFAGEGVIFLTEDTFADKPDDEVEDPFATVVLGVDTESPRFFDDHSVRVFVNATGTFTLTGEPLGDDPISRLRYPLPFALLTRVEYLVGESFKAELTFVDNLAGIDLFGDDLGAELLDHDLLLNPAVQMVFADVVTARVEAAFLAGPADGTFGRFPENSRVGASLGVSF